MPMFYTNPADPTLNNSTGSTFVNNEQTTLWELQVSKRVLFNGITLKWNVQNGSTERGQVRVYDAETREKLAESPLASIRNYVVDHYEDSILNLPEPFELLPGRKYLIGFYRPNSGYNYTTFFSGTAAVGQFNYTTPEGIIWTNTGLQHMAYRNGFEATGNSSNAWTMGIDYRSMPAELPMDLGEKTEAFTHTYQLSAGPASFTKLSVKINGIETETVTNPTPGTRNLTVSSTVFNSLKYGVAIPVEVAVTDAAGLVVTTKTQFKKMPTDDLSLLESVNVINHGMDRVKVKRSELASFLGLAKDSDFDSIIAALEQGALKRYAVGAVYVGTQYAADNFMNVRGLDFQPSIILIKATGVTNFGRSYMYVKQFATVSTASSFWIGDATSRIGYSTPRLYSDGFYFGVDTGVEHTEFINRMGGRVLEYIAIE